VKNDSFRFLPIVIGAMCFVLVYVNFPMPETAKQQTTTVQRDARWDEILYTLWEIESGCADQAPDGADGEIGPLQISRPYWEDSRVGGNFENCRDLAYSLRVVRAYMERWVPDAWEAADAEVILRTHNGGPRGAQRDSTLDYWLRAKRLMEQR
jgi:hypothetical protein